MNDKKYTLSSIAALFLSLFFSVIVLFYMFSFIRITNYNIFPAALTFTVINLIIINLLTSFCNQIIRKIGIATFKAICSITVIYSIFQFVHLGLQYDDNSISAYILYHLIILFVYSMVVIPLGIMGIRNKSIIQ